MYLLIFVLLIISSPLSAQERKSDSLFVPAAPILYQPLPINQDFFSDQRSSFRMKYINQSSNQMYFYKPPEFSSHPWEWDTRNSSFYTPRIVRDELNLIMNRPRENAFVPVLGVAYIAYQLASNYLAIQKKLIITADDIFSCRENLVVLTELWHTSPQTCSQLFSQQKLADLYSYNNLQEALNSLAEKNLVKVRTIENEEQQYFPAITSLEMRDILQRAKTDSTISKDRLDMIDPLLINYQGPPQ